MAKKDQAAADQSDPSLEGLDPAVDPKAPEDPAAQETTPAATDPGKNPPESQTPVELPPGSLVMTGGMVSATPSSDGGPAALPAGMKRFRLITPAGEQEEFVASCVQDAIRMRNGDGRGKVYTKKQLQIEVLEG